MALKPSVVETKNEMGSGHTLRTGNHIHDQHTLVIIIVPGSAKSRSLLLLVCICFLFRYLWFGTEGKVCLG